MLPVPTRPISAFARGWTRVLVDTWPRRLVLAWALQAGELLGEVQARKPHRLAPVARGTAEPAGPLRRLECADRRRGRWRAGVAAQWLPCILQLPAHRPRHLEEPASWLGGCRLLGNGELGKRGRAGFPPARGGCSGGDLGRLSNGVVQPASSIPRGGAPCCGIPDGSVSGSAEAAGACPMEGRQPERPGGGHSPESPAPQTGWAPDTSGPLVVSTFESPGERRLTAVLIGSRDDGRTHLRLVRLDSVHHPSGARRSGKLLVQLPLLRRAPRLDPGGRGKAGTGALAGRRGRRWPGGLPGVLRTATVGWNGAGLGQRGCPGEGASAPGRTLKEAWSNLLGATVPAPPGAAQTGRLEEARRWLQRADSALRGGNWSEFGHAWGSLRNALGLPPDTGRF